MLKAGLAVLNEPYFLFVFVSFADIVFDFIIHACGSVPSFNRLLFLQLGRLDTEADLQLVFF